jgi:hypothetical protein
LTGHVVIGTLLTEPVAWTEAAMKRTKTGSRLVVIRGTAPTSMTTAYREPMLRQALPQRIIVIRNGALVGSSPGR